VQKLYSHLNKEIKNGFDIRIVKAFLKISGWADSKLNCVFLNDFYIQGEINDLDENCMIGVLYHEIGHLVYYKSHPIETGEFSEEFKIKSEYFAFTYQLKKLMVIANDDDKEPVKASILKLTERITDIKNNNLSKETYSHIEALKMLAVSEIYKECIEFDKSLYS
jgi:hypothetical protein